MPLASLPAALPAQIAENAQISFGNLGRLGNWITGKWHLVRQWQA